MIDKAFAIQFTTDDCQVNARPNGVEVSANIDEKQFEDIIYRYGVIVIDMLEKRGLINTGCRKAPPNRK